MNKELRPLHVLLMKVFKITKEHKKFLIGNTSFETDGICTVIEVMFLDLDVIHEFEHDKMFRYLKTHKPFSYYFRRYTVYNKIKFNGYNLYYWKPFWLLPRKWYLTRHIFYCWIYYQFKKLFNG